MTDLLHRIRWTNLARAFAVLLAAFLAFSLLRAKHHEPTLPPALTEPPPAIAEADGEGTAGSGGEETGPTETLRAEPADDARADREEARQRAATRKAAKRRAARKATAERARKRRRTAARQRDARPAATDNAGAGARPWPPAAAPPAPAGAEFRP
jgi:hypothetical protein